MVKPFDFPPVGCSTSKEDPSLSLIGIQNTDRISVNISFCVILEDKEIFQ